MDQIKIKKLGVICGIFFLVLWGAGLAVFIQWLPPLSPVLDGKTAFEQMQANYSFHMFGVILMTVFSVLYLPWTVLLSELIKPVEAPSTFISNTQFVAGVLSTVTFFIPPFLWGAAAYRVRDPEITQALLDAGWLIFITGIGPFILQYSALAYVIFNDKRSVPAFPRWIGYLQVFISLSFLPAVIPYYIKTGPFAWNGVFVWWLPLCIFMTWYFSMIYHARKAILNGY